MRLRLLGHSRVTHNGDQPYVWEGNGAEQDVTVADASFLLLLQVREGPCCGGAKHDAGPLFEEVSDNTTDEAQDAPIEE